MKTSQADRAGTVGNSGLLGLLNNLVGECFVAKKGCTSLGNGCRAR